MSRFSGYGTFVTTLAVLVLAGLALSPAKVALLVGWASLVVAFVAGMERILSKRDVSRDAGSQQGSARRGIAG